MRNILVTIKYDSQLSYIILYLMVSSAGSFFKFTGNTYGISI